MNSVPSSSPGPAPSSSPSTTTIRNHVQAKRNEHGFWSLCCANCHEWVKLGSKEISTGYYSFKQHIGSKKCENQKKRFEQKREHDKALRAVRSLFNTALPTATQRMSVPVPVTVSQPSSGLQDIYSLQSSGSSSPLLNGFPRPILSLPSFPPSQRAASSAATPEETYDTLRREQWRRLEEGPDRTQRQRNVTQIFPVVDEFLTRIEHKTGMKGIVILAGEDVVAPGKATCISFFSSTVNPSFINNPEHNQVVGQCVRDCVLKVFPELGTTNPDPSGGGHEPCSTCSTSEGCGELDKEENSLKSEKYIVENQGVSEARTVKQEDRVSSTGKRHMLINTAAERPHKKSCL